mmetsp:Transcript_92514/g.267088  ORF Transcript_92514/g.267088 Transcript_92514/m.267088 type:complete len:592 (-) Transcript_92514:1117-2892(-)
MQLPRHGRHADRRVGNLGAALVADPGHGRLEIAGISKLAIPIIGHLERDRVRPLGLRGSDAREVLRRLSSATLQQATPATRLWRRTPLLGSASESSLFADLPDGRQGQGHLQHRNFGAGAGALRLQGSQVLPMERTEPPHARPRHPSPSPLWVETEQDLMHRIPPTHHRRGPFLGRWRRLPLKPLVLQPPPLEVPQHPSEPLGLGDLDRDRGVRDLHAQVEVGVAASLGPTPDKSMHREVARQDQVRVLRDRGPEPAHALVGAAATDALLPLGRELGGPTPGRPKAAELLIPRVLGFVQAALHFSTDSEAYSLELPALGAHPQEARDASLAFTEPLRIPPAGAVQLCWLLRVPEGGKLLTLEHDAQAHVGRSLAAASHSVELVDAALVRIHDCARLPFGELKAARAAKGGRHRNRLSLRVGQARGVPAPSASGLDAELRRIRILAALRAHLDGADTDPRRDRRQRSIDAARTTQAQRPRVRGAAVQCVLEAQLHIPDADLDAAREHPFHALHGLPLERLLEPHGLAGFLRLLRDELVQEVDELLLALLHAVKGPRGGGQLLVVTRPDNEQQVLDHDDEAIGPLRPSQAAGV